MIELWPLIEVRNFVQNFVSLQYFENKMIEFYQILSIYLMTLHLGVIKRHVLKFKIDKPLVGHIILSNVI